MAEFILSARTSFGATAAKVVSCGAVTLTERPDIVLASVAARAGQSEPVRTNIESRCGAPCPVSGYLTGPPNAVFWTGPDQWMVMSDQAVDLPAALKAEMGPAASVTDQTGGWVVFDLKGQDLTQTLERLCNIDLNRFGSGRAQRSVIEHIPCFVLCETPNLSYRLLCGRSFALSFAHAIETAMQVTHS